MQHPTFQNRRLEKFIALASFVSAVLFAFTAMYIADDHVVAAGNCTVCAQLLLLCASILGIDYKFNSYTHGNNSEGTPRPPS